MNIQLPEATHTGELVIGGLSLPCCVLNDQQHVFTVRAMAAIIGAKATGSSSKMRLAPILERTYAKVLIGKSDWANIKNPVQYLEDGRVFVGYKSSILGAVTRALAKADRMGFLKTPTEKRYAIKAEILRDALVDVAVDALIDEATGYQEYREKDALQKILERYLQGHARKWFKTFPDEFWVKLFRVKGYENYSALKRPSFVGHWVNDIVYDRLAPGIKTKLNELNPRLDSGKRKDKHHQFTTEDHGLPELREHLVKVMVLMDSSPNNAQFMRLLNRSLPKFGSTYELSLDEF